MDIWNAYYDHETCYAGFDHKWNKRCKIVGFYRADILKIWYTIVIINYSLHWTWTPLMCQALHWMLTDESVNKTYLLPLRNYRIPELGEDSLTVTFHRHCWCWYEVLWYCRKEMCLGLKNPMFHYLLSLSLRQLV